MTTLAFAPPKPVQRWSADDYARNGRFVTDLAGPVLAMLAQRKGERILDLGCGHGVLTAEIAQSGESVLGVDLSEELLAAARARGLDVRKADGHVLSFELRCGAALDAQARARDRGGGTGASLRRPLRR